MIEEEKGVEDKKGQQTACITQPKVSPIELALAQIEDLKKEKALIETAIENREKFIEQHLSEQGKALVEIGDRYIVIPCKKNLAQQETEEEPNPVIADARKLVKFFEGKSHNHAKLALDFAQGLISDHATITHPGQF